MTGPNDGGAAFPVSNGRDTEHGMTLRDWFAGHALAGFIEALEKPESAALLAKESYIVADAMISARKQVMA
jgi:hypothetical protein